MTHRTISKILFGLWIAVVLIGAGQWHTSEAGAEQSFAYQAIGML